MTGMSTTPPTSMRAILKASGPTLSMAWLCATKAVPQMNAVRNSSRLYLICFMADRLISCIYMR